MPTFLLPFLWFFSESFPFLRGVDIPVVEAQQDFTRRLGVDKLSPLYQYYLLYQMSSQGLTL